MTAAATGGHRRQRFWQRYLPLAFALAAAAGLGCVAQQQVLRLQADDPQVQLAEDGARHLAAGVAPAALLAGTPVELARDQSPFLMVFDVHGALTASSARLHGQVPALPAGVLRHAARQREHRLSWQPEPGVRHALVIVAVPGKGFVVAGRSLRETEARKRVLLHLYLLGTLAGLAGLAVLLWLAGRPTP